MLMKMRGSIWVWAVLLGLQFAACTDDKIVVGDGEDTVTVTQIFAGTDIAVDSVRVDWAPNGATILFAGHPPGGAGQVYRVSAKAGAIPVAVTDPQSNAIGATGYCPGFLMDGRIAFYAGRTGSAPELRIMVAAAGTIANTPPAEALHHFTHTDVGLAAPEPPREMSISGNGGVALGRWQSGHVLAWDATEQLTVTAQPEYGAGLAGTLSRNGDRIAYATVDGKIAWRPIAGGAVALVGEGHDPSWDEHGVLIGFIATDRTAYTVFNTVAGTSTTYTAPEGVALQLARLSMCGSMIAFRTGATSGSGIAMGTLDSAPG